MIAKASKPEPTVRPDHKTRSYICVKDRETGRSKSTTVYGLRPDEVLKAIALGVDELKRRSAVA